jgi:leucyl aminopeptidase
MEIALGAGHPDTVRAGLLALATTGRRNDRLLHRLDRATRGHLGHFVRRRGLEGADASLLYQTPPGTLAAEYVLLVRASRDKARTWRVLADQAVARAREVRARRLAVVAESSEALEILAETLDLAAYQFHGLKSGRRRPGLPAHVVVLGGTGRKAAAALARGRTLARAACLTRDLVNQPADIVTPVYLGAMARQLARRNRISVRVLREHQIRRLGMGALLGVARGSTQPPRFIELVYRPRRPPAMRVAIIGKGITFDSGGLSLKSSDSMQTQKRDMAGAAVVIGVMSALDDLGVRAEVRGYVPATENMPSGTALKPGDVLRARNGKTIEVLNTDAEGRLVLADALSHAAAAKPDVMIDFATLTAAVRTALGPRYAALLATDAKLAHALMEAAKAAGENLWQLPLVEEYRRDLDSTVADLKNTGEGHSGTIIGGLFLREFTAGIPWAHVDFSSTVVTERPFPGHARGASGFGVRTMLRHLMAL